jgi:LDH2 family malate/lactate/ureidoglycolate dehydrogenase
LMAGVAARSSFGRTEDTASPALGGDRVAKGFQFVVIDVERFMPAPEFRARVDTLIRDVHSSAPAEGVDHVYVPGEIEHLTRERRLVEGIPLSDGVLETLDKIAADVEVAPLLDQSRLAKDDA